MKITVNFEATLAWGCTPLTDEDVEVEVPDNFYTLSKTEADEVLKGQAMDWLSDNVGVVVSFPNDDD